jgi:serine protease Do
MRIYNVEELGVCKDLAVGGDPEAAMKVGDVYEAYPPFGGIVRPDPQEASSWYSRAADLGYLPAMRKLFDAYYFGHTFPKNSHKAEEYLLRAAGAGAQWARLLLASRLEKSEPQKALDFYFDLARMDNCHAQFRLAWAYYTGDLAFRNMTQAYFWLLLAAAGGFERKSESHLLYNPLSEPKESQSQPFLIVMERIKLLDSCSYYHSFRGTVEQVERSLSISHLRLAQAAASDWRLGQAEPLLPAPTVIAGQTSPESSQREAPRPTAVLRPPVPPIAVVAPTLLPPQWIPLPESAWRPRLYASLDSIRLFEVASQSVWLVFAARFAEESTRAGDVVLGSAIAVTSTLLLTNCHVIQDRPLVWIQQGDEIQRARMAFSDAPSDRCVLSVEGGALRAVHGMRGYSDLKVGEEVYSIGSPSGLEATLGQGVISGLRKLGQRRLLQTSAAISPGSSGGGLFDRAGNLIGITSFRLREGQNLNFAIAVEDYFQ